MERDDEIVARSLGAVEHPIDTDAAFARFRARADGARPAARAPWLRPAVVAAGVALILATATASGVAQTLFTIFQPKQVATVAVRTSDVSGLPDLRDFGSITWKVQPLRTQVPTLDAAERETGIRPLRLASPPAAIAGEPRIYTISRAEGSFAFDEARLRDAAARVGRTPPPLPPTIAASTLEVRGGPGVVQAWGGPFDPARPEQLPTLVIAQSRAPVVTSTGATLDELRAYLLAQPGLSPELVRQLEAIGDPAQTLLVPVPIDLASGRTVTVRGVQGVLVGDATGVGSALFWIADGIVHVVAGTIPDSELVGIADSLR